MRNEFAREHRMTYSSVYGGRGVRGF